MPRRSAEDGPFTTAAAATTTSAAAAVLLHMCVLVRVLCSWPSPPGRLVIQGKTADTTTSTTALACAVWE